MSKAKPTQPTPRRAKPQAPRRRLNVRALVVLTVVFLVVVPGLFALKMVQDSRGKSGLLREAENQVKLNQVSLALGYLNLYLERNPDDIDALDLKGKILAENARNEEQVAEAANINRLVIGRDGNNPKRQETRRRLIKLELRLPGGARSAEVLARKLIELGADDAEAHRLLGHALENLGVLENKADLLEQARNEYLIAEQKEPGDIEGAERLASLYRDRLEKPEKATEVYDLLVSATAKVPAKHALALLARSRHHALQKENAKADADLAQALIDAPNDGQVRLAAAQAAIQKRDPVTARQHLEAIDPSKREDLKIKETEGLIDLAEQRPDDAIAAWRSSLRQTGGNDADLTWRLAHVLLELGRIEQAEPLISQYRRLSGGELPNPRARYLRALSLLKSNHPKEALAEIEPARYKADKALEPHLEYLIGAAYESIRDNDKAIEAYKQAAETSRDWSAPWVAIARIENARKPSGGLGVIEGALAADPEDPKLLAARAQLLWTEQVQKPVAERSWTVFEEALNKAKKIAPGSPDVVIVEADYLMSIGKPEESAGLLEAATKINPRSTELWLAQVNALIRDTRLSKALDVLDRAIAAAGPQPGFFITKASILVMKTQVTAAKATLTEGLAKVTEDQKPLLWKTFGEFYQARKDYPSAKSAYEEWAKLQPDNPDPKIALVELALIVGDEPEIAKAVEDVRQISGEKTYFWRYARVEDLLRDRPGEAPDPARDAKRLADAQALATEIETNDPQLPLGFILEGRVLEKRKEIDKAIEAYKKALKLNGDELAVARLVSLLIREKRDQELDNLKTTLAGLSPKLERLAAVQALRMGNKGRAEQLAAMAVQGDPRGIDTKVWQAEVLNAMGKPKEAEEALQAIIAKSPTEAAPWLQLLMLQVAQKQSADALKTIDQIREKVKTPFPELLMAQCYRAAGELQKADDAYQAAMARYPNEMDVLKSAITFYEQAGRSETTEAALRAILRRDRRNGWATRKLAQTLAARPGNRAFWDEAISLVGTEARPDDVPDDLMARAAVYADGPLPEHKQKAVAILKGIVNEIPTMAVAQDRLARLLLASGDLQNAKVHAAKALAIDQPSPDSILLYAGILIALKDFDEAETQIGKLAVIDPDGLPLAELRARLLVAKGQGAQAAELLEKAFSNRSDGPETLFIGEKMVRLLSSLGQMDSAERVARRLGTIGPRAACILGELLSVRDKTDEALGLIRDAGKGTPDDAETAGTSALNLAVRPGSDPRWLPLAAELLGVAVKGSSTPSIDLLQKQALALHFQKKHPEEIEVYRAILARKPVNFMFLNNLAWTLSEDMGKPEEGIKWADEALKRVGPRSAILDTRGVILSRLNRAAEAVQDLEAAVKERPDGAILFHLARAYQKKGQAEEARKTRQRAQDAGLTRERLSPSEQREWDALMKA